MAQRSLRTVWSVALTIGAILIVCTLVGGYLWIRPPTVFYFSDARVSYKTGGTDFTVTFLVRDAKGRPMQGVRVASESYSGWTQYETTDDAGRAIVKPAEDEVIAVEVDGRIVHFRPKTRIEEELFLPHCVGGGLIVNVELTAKNAHPPPFR
jgi:hypothetical protein